jgi:electron transfer flavoprotein beta subunit
MLRIVVCIKQVPETQEVRLDPETHTLKREGVKSIINPFDLYAVEEGLRVKDAQGGRVTLITMGPPQAEEALREALGYGADEAVLVSDRAFAGADTWATALTLARAIEKLGGADLIFTGKQAIDGDTAQVGPMLATILDMPYVGWARKITFSGDRTIEVERLLDHGYDAVAAACPRWFRWSKKSTSPACPPSRPNSRPKKRPSRRGVWPIWASRRKRWASWALSPRWSRSSRRPPGRIPGLGRRAHRPRRPGMGPAKGIGKEVG